MIPKVGIIALTNKCNARCSMCNIWKKDPKDTMKLEHLEKLFKDPILSNHLESINLTGGEPTLRSDLIDITRIALENCNNLNVITLNTNGLNTNLVVDKIIRLCELMKSVRPFELQCFLSLDGIGRMHDEIRGVKGAYNKLLNTLKKLNELRSRCNFDFSLNFTINKHNIMSMEKVYNFCKTNRYKIDYTLSMASNTYFDNEEYIKMAKNELNVEYIANFLESRLMDGQFGNSRSYYRNLIYMLRGNSRKIGCIFQEEGFFLNANGDLYKCWAVDNKLGNILSDSFSRMWMLAKDDKNIQIVKEKCSECYNNCYAKYKRIDSIKSMLRGIS